MLSLSVIFPDFGKYFPSLWRCFGFCCNFAGSWSRQRIEKPVDYQDVRGGLRHVPPAITNKLYTFQMFKTRGNVECGLQKRPVQAIAKAMTTLLQDAFSD
jgi:hypothetical protein